MLRTGDIGIARYQLRAAARIPGSAIARASRSAASRGCLAFDCIKADSRGTVPSLARRYRSGTRGNWKNKMYHDARACRLVASDLSVATGCAIDIVVREARRSGLSAARAQATVAPQS